MSGGGHRKNLSSSGFTLSEVLITLGIIGVVAAITIPTLIANTNGQKYRSQFKKTLSTLAQAGLMAEAQYDFNYAGTTLVCDDGDRQGAQQHPDSDMSFCAILNGTLTGQTYHGFVRDLKRSSNGEEKEYTISTTTIPSYYKTLYIAYTLADGSIVAFHSWSKGCKLDIGEKLMDTPLTQRDICSGFIDVNGTSLPNKEVKCSVGTTTYDDTTEPCIVKNNDITDVFPITFHDATVEPRTNAAKYVLNTTK